MSRPVVRAAHLSFVLLASFSSSAFSSSQILNAPPPALQTTQSPFLKARSDCPECVNFRVTAFLFEPDPLVKVTYDMDRFQKILAEQGMLPKKQGFPLYLHADSKAVAEAFSPYGKFTQMLHWAGSSMPEEPLPLRVTTDHSSAAAVLRWSPVAPGSKAGLVSYALSAKSEDYSEVTGSGRVLLSTGSSLLEVYKLDRRYVVWLVQADTGV